MKRKLNTQNHRLYLMIKESNNWRENCKEFIYMSDADKDEMRQHEIQSRLGSFYF